MGTDPNYRGGAYHGQRMDGRGGGASYGRYRFEHGRELGQHGGVRGRNTGAGQLRPAPRATPSGPMDGPRPRSRGGRPGYGSRSPQGSSLWGSENRPFYDRDFPPQRPSPRGRQWGQRVRMSSGDRGGPGGNGGRRRGMNAASRPQRYDQQFNRFGGFRSSGFSEGYFGAHS
jgi:hypothetical protein